MAELQQAGEVVPKGQKAGRVYETTSKAVYVRVLPSEPVEPTIVYVTPSKSKGSGRSKPAATAKKKKTAPAKEASPVKRPPKLCPVPGGRAPTEVQRRRTVTTEFRANPIRMPNLGGDSGVRRLNPIWALEGWSSVRSRRGARAWPGGN
jgi:hypothetical protein